VRPERVSIAATWFRDNFPGEVLYAVKANPSPWALDCVYAAGLRWFDVASEDESQLIASRYPDAKMAFMHPVKSRKAIERAYFEHGVRAFSLDCEAELEKIVAATQRAEDLTLVVRLAVSNSDAGYALSGKFGIGEDGASALLQKARGFADSLGVSFHVGSQCMNPSAYRDAMDLAGRIIVKAGVIVDVVARVGASTCVTCLSAFPTGIFCYRASYLFFFDIGYKRLYSGMNGGGHGRFRSGAGRVARIPRRSRCASRARARRGDARCAGSAGGGSGHQATAATLHRLPQFHTA
jgi:hypothetical protein